MLSVDLEDGAAGFSGDADGVLAQLREVISKPTSGGGMSISSPRKKGGHGDLVSALVGAVHRLETTYREYAYEPAREPMQQGDDLWDDGRGHSSMRGAL